MQEFSAWDSPVSEEFPLSPEADPLGVLASTRSVVEQGELVWINREPLQELCEQWAREAQEQQNSANSGYEQYHFFDGGERSANWVLLLDALNFCFWAEGEEPRWSIDYQGEQLNGYNAEAAALTRAVAEGFPVWDAQYLRTIREEDMAHIFRGQQTIPLFAERVANAREVGRVLEERFAGQFARAIERVDYDAIALVRLLVEEFPSFRDSASYRGQTVNLLKRAQICVADLFGIFQGETWGALKHRELLTVFADYKLPQVLRHYHVIEYAPALAEQVDSKKLLPAGSEEELEIRAATVWACELMRRTLQDSNYPLHAMQIDFRLWQMGQQAAQMRPYHRTRTIYY